MSRRQSKITLYTKKQKNTNQIQKERQSMENNPKVMQIFKLVDKDFEAAIIIMHNITKKNT